MTDSRSKRCTRTRSAICRHTSSTAALPCPRAEKWKHVDGPEDRPFDVLVDQRFEVVKLALVDRRMQRARKTPEAVLCHVLSPEKDVAKGQHAAGKRRHR